MGDSTNYSSEKFGDPSVIDATGKILLMAIVLVLFMLISFICIHLYAKWFWRRRQETTTTTTHGVTVATVMHRGLDPSVLETIPVLVFDPEELKDGMECSVCLCEVSQGEKTRLLPKCSHGFHKDCIDMWFQSHSTCPLCRDPISNPNESSSSAPDTAALQAPAAEESSGQSPNFPTNVFFWGNETEVSTLGPCLEGSAASLPHCSSSSASTTNIIPNEMLVIDIPRRLNEEEDQKSPAPSHLRSLKRLLSGSMRFNPWSPKRNVDLEQGSSSQN